MASYPIIQHLRRAVLRQEGPVLTDGQLLGNYILHRLEPLVRLSDDGIVLHFAV